ncbi:hypothetical protein D3C72_2554140 [compost metagenome]
MLGITRGIKTIPGLRCTVGGVKRGFPLHGIQIGYLYLMAGGFKSLDRKILK